MSTTSWLSFSTARSVDALGYGYSWSNPTNVLIQDGNVTSWFTVEPGTYSDYLYVEGPVLPSIPNNAIIDGIEVRLYRKTFTFDTNYVADQRIFLLINDTPVGTNQSLGDIWTPNSYTWDTFGNSSSLWGYGGNITIADIDSNFGFYISGVTSGNAIPNLDCAQIRFTYSYDTKFFITL